MKYNFSQPYKNIQSSFIRDILKVANQKDFISFAGGLPNEKLFPKKELKQIFEDYSDNFPSDLLQYSSTMGLSKLIEIIKKQFHFKKDLLITNGSQQALDLICSILLNPKDKILVEEPSYLGAIGLFKSYGVKCQTVKLEEDGLDLKDLEKKLKKDSYKFLYVIPNFQNPSSISYSNKKRKKLAQLAIKYDLIIIEDDPYGFLNFKDKQYHKIFDLAPKNTIYLGSFSKILVPSLRLGFIMAGKKIMEKINIAKQYKDLHTNLFSQYILYEYLNKFDIFEHIKLLKIAYEKKGNLFYKTLKKELGDYFEVEKPKGGMFLWVRLKDNSNSEKLLQRAVKEKVLFVPGSVFLQDKSKQSFIRFNFTHSSKKEIKKGILRLKSLFPQA
ncbi:MAG: PLP-dependent aminotransferase family protein [Campylobacteraceae bacterium]|nr:PLP-dependent aminotransferase family protein [Campylobacteraceae bacterium]